MPIDIKNALSLVRKCPVTGVKPISVRLSNGQRVDVRWFDTMLLGPSHSSLQSLSAFLGPGEGKIAIPHRYKSRMDELLRDDPELFIRYALQDSAVTVKLWLLLQETLNRIAFEGGGTEYLPGQVRKLFRTLASAAVTGFLKKHPEFKRYRVDLGLKRAPQKLPLHPALVGKYMAGMRLIRRGYLGGRNEGFFVGWSAWFDETKNRLWIDIDFVGCYPTALSLVAKVDVHGPVDFIERTYQIDSSVTCDLERAGIPPEIVRQAREAVEHSPAGFERILRELKKSSHARLIREKAAVVDNRLIDSWRAKSSEGHLVNGVALVRFAFPASTMFPCIPVWHYQYGLIFPLRGETVATASEVLLAMEAGATIEALSSIELPTVTDKSGRPELLYRSHLSDLALKRVVYAAKAASDPMAFAMERLLKEVMNSFYGKFAQAVNPRKSYEVRTGEVTPLRSSAITEPLTATLTTGLARAALSATLLAIEQYNLGKSAGENIVVASATTDGMLIGLPNPRNLRALDFYNPITDEGLKLKPEWKSLPAVLDSCGCGELTQMIDSFLPNRQMRMSRVAMTGKPDYLEVKHFADDVYSVKTRGQIGVAYP